MIEGTGRVLPHERWIADRALRNAPTREGSAKWRLHQNYGPKGVALQQAGALDGLIGAAVMFLGVILIGVSEGDGAVGQAGYIMETVGILVALFGLVRLAQGAAAGRKFRDGRAFIRPRRLQEQPGVGLS